MRRTPGDSFITLHPESKETRIAAYRWKGFGFAETDDREAIAGCWDRFGVQ